MLPADAACRGLEAIVLSVCGCLGCFAHVDGESGGWKMLVLVCACSWLVVANGRVEALVFGPMVAWCGALATAENLVRMR